jgi:hypothetical protein
MRSFDKTNFAGCIPTQLAGLSGSVFAEVLTGGARNIGVPELGIEKNCDAKKKTLAFVFLRE